MKIVKTYNSKKLKKEAILCSYAMDIGNHCPMDYMLEEAQMFDDLNTLVVGIGECAFYSKLITFGNRSKHYSYRLLDNDLVFGCEKSIRQCVTSMLADNDDSLLVLVTCIPNIANLDIASYLSGLDGSDRVYLLAVPHFIGFSPSDSVYDFYSLLAKRLPKKSIKNGLALWTTLDVDMPLQGERLGDKLSLDKLSNMLCYSDQVVLKKKYLKGVSEFCERNNRRFYDFTDIKTSAEYRAYYEQLGIDTTICDTVKHYEDQLACNKLSVAVKSRWGVEVAKFLSNLGIKTSLLIVDDFNSNSYDQITSVQDEITIVNSYSSTLEQISNHTYKYDFALDLSKLDYALSQLYGCQRTARLCTEILNIINNGGNK